MSAHLEALAEIANLARLLEVEPDSLAYLEQAARMTWQFVLRLEPLLPPTSQPTLATIAGALDLHVLERATAAAREHGLWVPLIGLASQMDEPGRRRVAGLTGLSASRRSPRRTTR